jgi:excinuclease UvrABC nuclease subunit
MTPNGLFINKMLREGWISLYDADRAAKRTPKESGIYCFVNLDIFTGKSEVVYVGKSIDLSVRLKPWHKVERIWDNKMGTLICFIQLTSDQDNLEKQYIAKYKPVFNVQHNPKIRRKIVYQFGTPLN